MSENSNKFIILYTDIEDLLRGKLHAFDQRVDFSEILSRAKDKLLITENNFKMLQIIGRLRNAIIHDKTFVYPTDSIAEPHDKLIKMMENIQESLSKPLLVQNLKAAAPYVFNQNDNLLDCLKLMRERDYSQVVIQFEKSYGLFTREDEAKWLEQKVDRDVLQINFKDIKIKDIKSLDIKDQCVFIPKITTAIKLVEIFRQYSRSNVAAVLVTENGKQSEKPIKIFTHWDLPGIIEKIELY